MLLLHSSLILLASMLTTIQACGPPLNASEAFQLGNDSYPDAATLGYSMNHFALLVNDLEASTHFYSKVLGMRHVFTFHTSPTFSITYLSYSQGGLNGTGFQTGQALYDQKTNTQGQVELIYRKDCGNKRPKLTPSTQRESSFSHVGLVVPDVKSFQKRMEKFEVPILKRTGESITPKGQLPAAKGFGYGDNVQEGLMTVRALSNIGFDQFLLILDPDGNMVEVQPEQI